MDIQIRTADISDGAAIAEISSNELGYECAAELVTSKLSSLDKKRECVFTAVSDGNVIGFIHVEKYNTLYFEALSNVLALAVKSEYQRCGAGRMLISAAESWAKENGAHGIRLNSGSARQDAHKFYRTAGFDTEKEQLRFMKMFNM